MRVATDMSNSAFRPIPLDQVTAYDIIKHLDIEYDSGHWLQRALTALNGREISREIFDKISDQVNIIRAEIETSFRCGKISIFRGLREFPGAGRSVGLHWSISESKAKEFGDFQLRVEIGPECVDWVSTISKRIGWARENEVTVLPDLQLNLGRQASKLDAGISVSATFTIDGVARSLLNSNGELIADNERSLRDFWEWFGDSAIVDDASRPICVYHGSGRGDFEEFNTDGAGKTSDTGAFFSDSFEVAGTYGCVRSFYLRSGERVATVNFEGRHWNSAPVDFDVYDQEGDFQQTYQSLKEAERAAGTDGSVIERALTIDSEGCLTHDPDDDDGSPHTTDSLAATARRLGFSSFVAENVIDVKSGAATSKPSTVFVMYDARNIKSVQSFRSVEALRGRCDMLVDDATLGPSDALPRSPDVKSPRLTP